MKVSIITPTYNRADQLHFYLDALANQTWEDFELILVNDGSTDHTREVIDQLKASSVYAFSIKPFHIKNAGRSGARNFGAKHALREVFVFYDDDTRPNPDSLSRHVAYHQARKNHILGGPYVYDRNKIVSGFQAFRVEMEDKWYDLEAGIVPVPSLRINGGNFSIEKRLFAQVGGFNEQLKDKEDFLLAYQAVKYHNSQVFLDPSTWVYHDDFKSYNEYINRLTATTAEEQKLLGIETAILEFQPQRFKKGRFGPVRSMLNKTLCLGSVRRLLSSKAVEKWVPRKIQYKIFDLAITAHRDSQMSIDE